MAGGRGNIWALRRSAIVVACLVLSAFLFAHSLSGAVWQLVDLSTGAVVITTLSDTEPTFSLRQGRAWKKVAPETGPRASGSVEVVKTGSPSYVVPDGYVLVRDAPASDGPRAFGSDAVDSAMRRLEALSSRKYSLPSVTDLGGQFTSFSSEATFAPAASTRLFGSPYRASGSGGSVPVRGYTRKNGTYVRSYTRRAPSR